MTSNYEHIDRLPVVRPNPFDTVVRKNHQSGAEGSRTLDLCIANAALSQLSYRPDQAGGTLWKRLLRCKTADMKLRSQGARRGFVGDLKA